MTFFTRMQSFLNPTRDQVLIFCFPQSKWLCRKGPGALPAAVENKEAATVMDGERRGVLHPGHPGQALARVHTGEKPRPQAPVPGPRL